MAYPIILNLNGRLVVVAGGGQVATRKVSSLIGQGAIIRVVAPAVTEHIEDLARAGLITIVRREFEPTDVDGAFLAHAATNSRDVNALVVQAAFSRKALICSADSPDDGSFTTPSTVVRGKLMLSISTGGENPTLAAVLRDRLEAQYGPEYDLWVQLFARLREAVQNIDSLNGRKAWVNRILDMPEIKMLIAAGKLNEAEMAARHCI